MRHSRISAISWTIVGLLSAVMVADGRAADPDPSELNARARLEFQDKKFGMFIHWGVYSLLGKGEWVMDKDKLPISEYEKLPPRFNPVEFDAELLAKTAKAAGMKYLTVTTKHHDGFCMFDSKLTRFDIVDATPYGKDPIKALADACRKHKITLFFYYSLLDWHHPDYFPLGRTGKTSGRDARGDWAKYVAYYQGQIRELCTNYGEIGGIWFDGLWDRPEAPWELEATYKLIHSLQPKALVGNNHHSDPIAGEDLQIFEKDFPGENTAGFNKTAPYPTTVWEMCETINHSWGYNAADNEVKTTAELIRLLVGAAGRNANLLLNVGPKPDGTLPKQVTERLAEVGRRLETNGDSIYGTRGGQVVPQAWGVTTTALDDHAIPAIYVHILDFKKPIFLPTSLLAYQARVLGNVRATPKLMKHDGRALLTVPESERSAIDTVIVLSPAILEDDPRSRLRERR